MNSESQDSELVLKLLNLFMEIWDVDTNSIKAEPSQKKEFCELCEKIIEDLIWAPGKLIYVPDETERVKAQCLVDLIWSKQESEELFDQMVGGSYTGLLVEILGDYTDRAKMLKPTFISVNPKNIEFSRYYEDAMRAWLFGLNSAALILCCSIIEDTLKEQLYNLDPNLALILDIHEGKVTGIKNKKMEKLIYEAANHNIIDIRGKRIAHRIRELRNSAIHSLEKIDDSQTYQAILDTKELIEKILTTSTTW